MKKLSRLESNKETRRILNRNGVDLGYCQFSCYGTDVILTGWLCHTDESDFTGPQIEAMIYDFHRQLPGYTITGDLDNWSFNSERISYIGDKDNINVNGGGLAEEEQKVWEIDLDDYDFEAS